MTSRLPRLGSNCNRTKKSSRTTLDSSTNSVISSSSILSLSTNEFDDLSTSFTSTSSNCHRKRSNTLDLGPAIDEDLPCVETEFCSHIGGRVLVGGQKVGILRFFGYVHVRQGLYCGVELLEPAGNHDGVLQGKRYFTCPSNYGIFAPASKVELLLTQVTHKDSRPSLITSVCHSPPSSTMNQEETNNKSPPFHGSARNSRDRSPEFEFEFEGIMDVEPPSMYFETTSIEDVRDTTCNETMPMDLDTTLAENEEANMNTESTTSIPPDDPMTLPLPSVDPTDPRPISADTGYHGDSDNPHDISHDPDTSIVVLESEESPPQAPMLIPDDDLESGATAPKSAKKVAASSGPSKSDVATNSSSTMNNRPIRKSAVSTPIIPPKPRAPKVPSKSQMIMEQLKASMKAEKYKPPVKSEIKSKVMEDIKPTEPKKIVEKSESSKAGEMSSVRHESVSSMPNASSSGLPQSSGLPRKAPVKRALKAPINAAKRPPLKPVFNSTVTNPNLKTKAASPLPNSVRHQSNPHTNLSVRTTPQLQATTSLKSRKVDLGKSSVSKGNQADKIQQLEEKIEDQKAQLVQSRHIVDVLSITTRYYNENRVPQVLAEARNEIRRVNSDREQEKIEDTVKLEQVQNFNQDQQAALLKKEQEIQKLKSECQKNADLQAELEFTKLNFEAQKKDLISKQLCEVSFLQAENEEDIKKLQNDVTRIKAECSKAQAERKKLELVLMQDAAVKAKTVEHRFETLNKELASLQTVVEMKNLELKELRPKADQLKDLTQQLQQKENEINKLTQHSQELKERFEQQREVERSMRKSYGEMRSSVNKMQNQMTNTALERDELLALQETTASPNNRSGVSRARSSLSECEPCEKPVDNSIMARSCTSTLLHQEARKRQQKGRTPRHSGVEVQCFPADGSFTRSLILDLTNPLQECAEDRERFEKEIVPTTDSGVFTSSMTSSNHQ